MMLLAFAMSGALAWQVINYPNKIYCFWWLWRGGGTGDLPGTPFSFLSVFLFHPLPLSFLFFPFSLHLLLDLQKAYTQILRRERLIHQFQGLQPLNSIVNNSHFIQRYNCSAIYVVIIFQSQKIV
jgi:hypothetical protein